jgi:hypothetical protein
MTVVSRVRVLMYITLRPFPCKMGVLEFEEIKIAQLARA